MYPRRAENAAPWLCGHRGHSIATPENTLASIRATSAEGGHAAEVDLRLSADGVAVLMHDASLDRTTDARGLVSDLTAAALTRTHAGMGHGAAFADAMVPTLQEAAILAAEIGLKLQVEVKEYDRNEAVLDALMALPMAAWQGIGLISSFDWAQVAMMRRRITQVPMLAIMHGRAPHLASWFVDQGMAAISMQNEYLRAEDAEAFRKAGLALSVAVPRPEVLETLTSYGHPDKARLLSLMRDGLVDQILGDDVGYLRRLAG